MKLNFKKLQTVQLEMKPNGDTLLRLHNKTGSLDKYDCTDITLTKVNKLTPATSPEYVTNKKNDAGRRRSVFTAIRTDIAEYYVGSSMINKTFGTYFDVAVYDDQAIISISYKYQAKGYATRFSVALDFDKQNELTGTNYYKHSIKGLANTSYEDMTALTSKSKVKASKATRTQLLTDLLFEIGNDINLGKDCSSELSTIEAFAIGSGLIVNNSTELEDLLNGIEAANEPELAPEAAPAFIEAIEVQETYTIVRTAPEEAPERSMETIVKCLHAETGTESIIISKRLNELNQEAVIRGQDGYSFYMEAFKRVMVDYINYDFNPTCFHHFTERVIEVRIELNRIAHGDPCTWIGKRPRINIDSQMGTDQPSMTEEEYFDMLSA